MPSRRWIRTARAAGAPFDALVEGGIYYSSTNACAYLVSKDSADRFNKKLILTLQQNPIYWFDGFDRYVDIFDGGPTVTAPTDKIRTVRESATEKVCEIGDGGKTRMIVATGCLMDFRACFASAKRVPRKGLCIDEEAASMLGVKVGDQILAVAR